MLGLMVWKCLLGTMTLCDQLCPPAPCGRYSTVSMLDNRARARLRELLNPVSLKDTLRPEAPVTSR